MNMVSTTLPKKIVNDSSPWQSQQNWKYSQLSKPEIEYNVMKEMCVALGMHTAHMLRKDNFLGIFKTFIKKKIYNCEDRIIPF